MAGRPQGCLEALERTVGNYETTELVCRTRLQRAAVKRAGEAGLHPG